MGIYVINPLTDARWDALADSHPRASAFHQRGWLQALAHTYRYQALAITSSAPNQALRNGIVLCRVSSWLTGTRLVSLPFADHCEPLVEGNNGEEFGQWLREHCVQERGQYVEIRPLSENLPEGLGLLPSRSFFFHTLDMTASREELFQRLHKDSIRRKIQRAEREGLVYDSGNSPELVDEFYRLLLVTRRRHQLLPQPKSWFRNIVKYMGEKARIRLARKDGMAIAAMMTLRSSRTMIYKYGCSDEKYHSLGGMPFLFWRLIEESKETGVQEIDFGRSDLDQESLSVFKDRFGTIRRKLTYFRYENPKAAAKPQPFNAVRGALELFCKLPDSAFSTAGKLLYRHMG